ncbi:Hypothetical protein AA314_02641 [Archangium gephyra]|uniref:Uncharacterized protein n=1 Tax=Archangium gephyra TaxID=48 RepID=A0AAC8Q4N2_9BACT|nr:Hypothetical protein AA314_02641 [Archangium gephyra]
MLRWGERATGRVERASAPGVSASTRGGATPRADLRDPARWRRGAWGWEK